MDGFVVRIDRLIVRTIDFGPVAIRVQNVEKEGIGNAVPPGPAFDIIDITGGRHHIQQVDDIHRRWHPEGNVMQPRAGTIGKGDIMHTAFAMHPCRPQMAGFRILGIFGRAKAQIIIETDAGIHIRRKTVEMVDPQRLDAGVARILLMNGGQSLHFKIELQRNAVRVKHPQRASLKRPFHPFSCHALVTEIGGCLVDIILGIDAEGQIAATGRIALCQHQTVMPAFFHRAQANLAAVLICHLQAQRIDIKGAAGSKITDHKFGMRNADNVERRVKVKGRHRHGRPSYRPSLGTARGADAKATLRVSM